VSEEDPHARRRSQIVLRLGAWVSVKFSIGSAFNHRGHDAVVTVAKIATSLRLDTDAFDAHALHVGAMNVEGNLRGTARLVQDRVAAFPLLLYCSIFSGETELYRAGNTVADVSRLSVSRRYRRRRDDSRLCPVTSKVTTFDGFAPDQLCVPGGLRNLASVLTSSGHGGRFSFGVSYDQLLLVGDPYS